MFISNLSGTGNALPKFGTWIGADADLREKMTSKQKTELIDVQSKFVFDTIKTDGNIQFVEGDKVPGTVVAIGYPEIKKSIREQTPVRVVQVSKTINNFDPWAAMKKVNDSIFPLLKKK